MAMLNYQRIYRGTDWQQFCFSRSSYDNGFAFTIWIKHWTFYVGHFAYGYLIPVDHWIKQDGPLLSPWANFSLRLRCSSGPCCYWFYGKLLHQVLQLPHVTTVCNRGSPLPVPMPVMPVGHWPHVQQPSPDLPMFHYNTRANLRIHTLVVQRILMDLS